MAFVSGEIKVHMGHLVESIDKVFMNPVIYIERMLFVYNFMLRELIGTYLHFPISLTVLGKFLANKYSLMTKTKMTK